MGQGDIREKALSKRKANNPERSTTEKALKKHRNSKMKRNEFQHEDPVEQGSEREMITEFVPNANEVEASSNARMKERRLPVTILSGFLGSGKTTLLRHILQSTSHGLRIALIVNDMAEVNIDGVQIARLDQSKSKEIVQMQNGCICCTLRGDFIIELAKLARSDHFDYLIIESSGISEPIQVAESFALEMNKKFLEMDEGITKENRTIIEEVAESGGLAAIAKIDTMVTVVDAYNFLREFQTGALLRERFAPEDVPEDDQRTISDLFADQLEFANVIVINKLDLVDLDTKKRVISLVKTFSPTAEILETIKAKVDVKKLVNTGKFDYEEAQANPGWLRSLQEMSQIAIGGKIRLAPKPETLEYGIGSFVYTSRKPFDPLKFYNLLKGKFVLFQPSEEDEEEVDGDENSEELTTDHGEETDGNEDEMSSIQVEEAHSDDRDKIIETKRNDPIFSGIYRIKGFVWLVTRPRVMGAISAAGAILNIHGEQDWCAENVFGSCEPYVGKKKDTKPIKDLAVKLGGACHKYPFLTASETETTLIAEVLDSCYFTSEQKAEWHEIVKSNDDDDVREELLQDIVAEKFGDIDLHFIHELCKDLGGKWGDRRQEIVFIGEGLRPEEISMALDACLLSDEEMVRWETSMVDDSSHLDTKTTIERLEGSLARASSIERKKKILQKIGHAKSCIIEAKEAKLREIWDESYWVEWLPDAEKSNDEHEHDHDHEHLQHNH